MLADHLFSLQKSPSGGRSSYVQLLSEAVLSSHSDWREVIQTHMKTLASAQNRFLTFEYKSVTKKISTTYMICKASGSLPFWFNNKGKSECFLPPAYT